MGVSLLLQKQLAASVLKCGKRKVWLDPSEINEISMANSVRRPALPPPATRDAPVRRAAAERAAARACCAAGQNIRKLVKDGFAIQKPQKVHRAGQAHGQRRSARRARFARRCRAGGVGARGGAASGREASLSDREAAAPSARRRDATLATATEGAKEARMPVKVL